MSDYEEHQIDQEQLSLFVEVDCCECGYHGIKCVELASPPATISCPLCSTELRKYEEVTA